MMTALDTSKLNIHLADLESSAAAEAARSSFDRMSELARDAANGLEIDRHLEEASQFVKNAVQSTAIRAAIARLERELPDTDRGRYDRAYLRGRSQARAIYMGLGLAAGISAGVAAALLLDPRSGRRRREALKARARRLADRSSHAVRKNRVTPANEVEAAIDEAAVAIGESLPVVEALPDVESIPDVADA